MDTNKKELTVKVKMFKQLERQLSYVSHSKVIKILEVFIEVDLVCIRAHYL